MKSAGGDPEKLKRLVGEVDKTLEAKHCPTRLDVTADGKVLVSDTGKNTALAYDPKTGQVEAKSVQHNQDGSMLVNPGEVVHADADKVLKEIGDNAVNGTNGKFEGFSAKNMPIALGGRAHFYDLSIPPIFPHPWIEAHNNPPDGPPVERSGPGRHLLSQPPNAPSGPGSLQELLKSQ